MVVSWMVMGLVLASCGLFDPDRDGFSVGDGDCNDANANVAPGLSEQCDGLDQNCDGIIDNDPTDGVMFFRDNDRDTYGDDDVTRLACTTPDGFAPRGGDCDDANPDANPGGVDSDTEDLDCDGTVDDPVEPKTFEGPTEVDSVRVRCDVLDIVFEVRTTGVTDGGVIFIQETGNTIPHWSEEHDLESVNADPDGFFDELERSVPGGVKLGVQGRNVGSLFPCDLFDEDVMTLAVQVTDPDGKVSDCLIVGDDPAGMADETYDRLNEPSFDLSTCRLEGE